MDSTPNLYHPIEKVNYNGSTLIIPSVSVGNVGQLCADLLIQTLGCRKTGYIWHPAILPVVGVDPYKISSPILALSAEIYYSEVQKLIILQLRSSIIKKLRRPFLTELVNWVKASGIVQVAILTGSSNEERIDDQIMSEPFRYLVLEENDAFSSLGWIALERRLQFPALSKLESIAADPELKGQIVIPGGGFTKGLLEVCSENGVQCVALIKFCSEGDNIPDALMVMTKLNGWLKLVKEDSGQIPNWVFPPSWSHLFGNPPPRVLY